MYICFFTPNQTVLETSLIRQYIERYKEKGLRLFSTSSFQTHSIVLLHILSRIDRSIPIYFINTGFHFPETIVYRDQITELLGLNLIDLHSGTSKHLQKDASGKLLFTSDPDFCCHLNKVQPLDNVLAEYDVWINGVRADQSAVRKQMKVEQPAPHGTLRFHPMLDWNSKMIWQYIKEHNIPRHPLEAQGYSSIGCEPCTRKFDAEMLEREGRWYGLQKTECGLHTELINK
jgi:phosphoadenosine phosphosulfate reductase